MTATQNNLARWREAERGATEGPWEADSIPQSPDARVAWVQTRSLGHTVEIPATRDDADFIATSREAMPALLAFAEAVLALHKPCGCTSPREPHCEVCGGAYPCQTVILAEQHLAEAGRADH